MTEIICPKCGTLAATITHSVRRSLSVTNVADLLTALRHGEEVYETQTPNEFFITHGGGSVPTDIVELALLENKIKLKWPEAPKARTYVKA